MARHSGLPVDRSVGSRSVRASQHALLPSTDDVGLRERLASFYSVVELMRILGEHYGEENVRLVVSFWN